MLPTVQLRQVTRDDVHRIARWLTDEDVSSHWFGHYACGDPVHRGYEPGLMLNASTEDWVRVVRPRPEQADLLDILSGSRVTSANARRSSIEEATSRCRF